MQAGSHIDKEVQFAGILPEIPMTLDPSSRTEVLKMIDVGLKEKRLTSVSSLHVGAILHIDVNSVKLFSDDKQQEPVLRMPIHQVAAVSYIKEDEQHIISIKFGEVTKSHSADETLTCNLAILYCDSRTTAEQICSFVDLCFQFIYTDATMNFFDTSLTESSQTLHKENKSSVAPNNNPGVTNLSQLSTQRGNLGFLSHSSLNIGNNGSTSSGTGASYITRQSSESEISPAANELILDYMKKLYTKLNTSELQEFAMLVKAWHMNMMFPEFCQKVLDVYGSQRKHLLVGMRPFIPAKDSMFFEHFLQQNGCVEGESLFNSQISVESSWILDGQQQYRRDSFDSMTDGFEMVDCSSLVDDFGPKFNHDRT